jgi:hypothetical protein
MGPHQVVGLIGGVREKASKTGDLANISGDGLRHLLRKEDGDGAALPAGTINATSCRGLGRAAAAETTALHGLKRTWRWCIMFPGSSWRW